VRRPASSQPNSVTPRSHFYVALASTPGSSAMMEIAKAAAPSCCLASAAAWVWPGLQQSSAIQDTGMVWHWISKTGPLRYISRHPNCSSLWKTLALISNSPVQMEISRAGKIKLHKTSPAMAPEESQEPVLCGSCLSPSVRPLLTW